MGIEPPFLYDAVGRESVNFPFSGFNFKGSPRATPRRPQPNYEAPLINSTRNGFVPNSSPNRQSFASTSSPTRRSFASLPKSQFDKHPDSWTITPSAKSDAKPMKPSTKTTVTRIRIVQLVLRCLQLLGSIGLLVITILISNIPSKIGLVIRIPAGVAILHTIYGVYHLSRRPSGRTPGSTASYMLFAACFDVSLIPFYAFTAMLSESQHSMLSHDTKSNEWSTILPGGRSLLPKLTESLFLLAVITGGFHLISFVISIWLGVVFRRINRLPPDMNPLEDNLTSRHSRSKNSSIILAASEKRLSEPLESKRSSGAAYEDLLRPPTLPFHHGHSGSVESFSTYHSTPPPSRDSHSHSPSRDLPSRQYQIPSPRSSIGLQTQLNTSTHSSPRSSLGLQTETQLKANTQNPTLSSPKRSSYTAVPLSNDNLEQEKIYTTTSPLRTSVNQKDTWFGSDSIVKTRKPVYEPIAQQSFDDFEFSFPGNSSQSFTNYPNRQSNHSSPRPSHKSPPSQSQPHSQHQNKPPTSKQHYSNHGSVDIASRDLTKIREESRDSASLNSTYRESNSHHIGTSNGDNDSGSLKGKYYGDLRPGTPPIIVGTMRQISTGTDVHNSFRVMDRRQREVSGKVAEEGRAGGSGGWGERLRRVSAVLS